MDEKDESLPKHYKDALEPHVIKLVDAANKMLPIITEFGNLLTCICDDVEITIRKVNNT